MLGMTCPNMLEVFSMRMIPTDPYPELYSVGLYTWRLGRLGAATSLPSGINHNELMSVKALSDYFWGTKKSFRLGRVADVGFVFNKVTRGSIWLSRN